MVGWVILKLLGLLSVSERIKKECLHVYEKKFNWTFKKKMYVKKR